MLSAQLYADLRTDEGWRALAYDDATGQPITRGSVLSGYPTGGYGCRLDLPMPRAVGELWMQLRAEGNWAELLSLFPWLANQPDDVQRGLQNMVYTMGATRVSNFGLMLAALERGDRETAAVNVLHSKWAEEAPARADRVANLIRGQVADGHE